MAIVEEAVKAGIEEICIVVQKADQPIFEEFFQMLPGKYHFYQKKSDVDILMGISTSDFL